MTDKNFKDHVKKMILLQNVLIVVLVASLLVFSYIKFRPRIVTLSVPDECGIVGNLESHPIPNEDACINACHAACLSMDKGYHGSDFSTDSNPPCFTCSCECK